MDLLTRSFQSTHRETFHSNMSPGEISDSDDDEDMQYRLTREYSLLGLSAKHAATISTIHVTSLHAAILISSNEIFHISGEGSQSVCNWYSAVVCCVSIGRLLSLPLRSYLLPATTISSVAQVGIMMFVTLCGEGLFVYFLECSLHSETEFILQIAFSRVLMGFGANGIEVAVGFIERFAASSSTLKTMRALFRSAERVHQWWAPLCFGIVFSWLPIPTPNLLCGTSIADLFNFYTLPSWVVVISAFMWLLIAGCTLQCSYIPSMFLVSNTDISFILLSACRVIVASLTHRELTMRPGASHSVRQIHFIRSTHLQLQHYQRP
jgi:hypothetical protein